MSKSIKPLLFFGILIITGITRAQSDNDKELHNRYWTYRENFRKYFTSIGKETGQGLPFSHIDVSPSFKYPMIDGAGNDKQNETVKLEGRLNTGGDITAYMAEYMGILASEYWLLQNNGMGNSDEMKAVKNELYFAINAIERLDKYSKLYFEGSPTTEIDGFFVRDDSEPKVTKYLEICNYPKVQFVSGNTSQGRDLDLTKTDYIKKKYISWITDPITNQAVYFRFNKQNEFYFLYKDQNTNTERENEMSMDQLVGVLFGFKCIIKFIDNNVEIDPDGPYLPLPNKNLHAWVKQLTDKMMLHLSKTTYDVHVKAQNDLDADRIKKCEEMNKKPWVPIGGGFIRYSDQTNCVAVHGFCIKDLCDNWKEDTEEKINLILASQSTYVITNPNNGGKEVSRGFQAFGFGYPLEKLGEEITGNNYPEVSLTPSPLFQAARLMLDVVGAVYAPASQGGSLILSPDMLSLVALGRPVQPQNANWWRDLYNAIPSKGRDRDVPKEELILDRIKKSDAAAMFIWLPAASGTWEHQEYYNMMSQYNRIEADVLWSVLNDATPYIGSSIIESRLLSSNCEAIQNDVNEATHAPFNKISYFSKIGSNGNGESGYTNNWYDNAGDKDEVSLYNGMDWMLLYNFYRIADTKNLIAIKEFQQIKHPSKSMKPRIWKNNGSNLSTYERLPKFKNSYCPCKSSYEFYADRQTNSIKPSVYLNAHHILRTPLLTTPTGGYQDLGNLKMFNKDYESYGIHLSDYLTQKFEIFDNGLLAPQGNLTVCGNGTELTIHDGGELKTASLPSDPSKALNPGQTIRIRNGAVLEIEEGGKLTIENDTKVIIEEGAILKFWNNAIINLKGLNSELIIQGSVQLAPNTTFKLYLNPDFTKQHGQIIIDRWYKEGTNQPLVFTSTDGKGRINFAGKYKGDPLVKVIGNDGLTIASSQIEFASFKNCRVSFGEKEAKLLLEPKIPSG